MRAMLILVAVVMTALAVAPSAPGHEVRAQPAEGALPTACSTTDAPAAVTSTLDDGLPPALSMAVLADQQTEQWPPFANSLVLTIRRIALIPGAATEIRRTQGPLLFYVESGSVGLSINGRMQPQSPGVSTLVQTGQHYLLRNDATEPAAVLRLALVPPEDETTVGRGEVAQVIEQGDEIAASPGTIESRLLLRADVPVISGTAHLFLACLSWHDPGLEAGESSHPGPVGYLVLDGQLLVGEGGTLHAGDCTLFPTLAPRVLRAGDPPPTLLVFGAVPGGQPLWIPVTADTAAGSTGTPGEFECGDPSTPAEPPAAAALAPGHPERVTRL